MSSHIVQNTYKTMYPSCATYITFIMHILLFKVTVSFSFTEHYSCDLQMVFMSNKVHQTYVLSVFIGQLHWKATGITKTF